MSGRGSVGCSCIFGRGTEPVSIHGAPLEDVTRLKISNVVSVWEASCAGRPVIVRLVPNMYEKDEWDWCVGKIQAYARPAHESDAWWKYLTLEAVNPWDPPKLAKKFGEGGVWAVDAYGSPSRDFSVATPTHLEGIALAEVKSVFYNFTERPYARSWTARCSDVTVIITLWCGESTRNRWTWKTREFAETDAACPQPGAPLEPRGTRC